MSTSNQLAAADVMAVDTANQMADILAMPDHIEDALWRFDSAQIVPTPAAGLVICGMGGSAIGGDLATAVLGSRTAKPIQVVRDYELPSWVTSETAVLCSSYSGNTEETLACYEAAGRIGAPRYVASAGGLLSERAHADGVPVIGIPGILQPRASVGYMTVAALSVAGIVGAAPAGIRAELDAVVGPLRELCSAWGPDGATDGPAKQLARTADGKLVAIYGNGLTTPIAYRWKCQINENVKVPCWSAVLPEANHNDINGWGGANGLGPHLVVFLRDADQNERVQKRIGLTQEAVGESAVQSVVIDSTGTTRSDRLFASVLLGDLTSVYMATLRGVDPSPVPVIEHLKDALGRPGSK